LPTDQNAKTELEKTKAAVKKALGKRDFPGIDLEAGFGLG
jgi:hypothetical protein